MAFRKRTSKGERLSTPITIRPVSILGPSGEVAVIYVGSGHEDIVASGVPSLNKANPSGLYRERLTHEQLAGIDLGPAPINSDGEQQIEPRIIVRLGELAGQAPSDVGGVHD